MWELNHKESWVLKNWCFWTTVLEKTLESPLDCKEIQVVNPKGNQSWIFIGRTESESCNTLATWCEELTPWKRSWCWEGMKVGGEGDDKGWDGWMASPTQWTWVWASSGNWWKIEKPGVLQSMGSQTVRHDWATELNTLDVPGGSVVENPPANAGDGQEAQVQFLGWGRPLERKWQPTPVFWPGKSHGQRSLVCYSPQVHRRVRNDLVTKQQQQQMTYPWICQIAFSQVAKGMQDDVPLWFLETSASSVFWRVQFLTTSTILSTRIPMMLSTEEHFTKSFYRGSWHWVFTSFFWSGFQHSIMCFFIIMHRIWPRDGLRVIMRNVHRRVYCPQIHQMSG